jgi:hypothetical protein
MATPDPRLTAILPTADRRMYVPSAIAQFLVQDCVAAELLILDDGADAVADLVPRHPRVRYVRDETRRNIGDKRNRLCEMATGEIILHWDDDDWHAPNRISKQLAAMDSTGADICGLADIPFLAGDGARAWDYRWGGRYRWVYGASLAYRRAYWRAHPFPALRHGEDTRFVFEAQSAHVHVMPEEGWLIACIHAGNTCPKQLAGAWWHPRDPAPLLSQIAGWEEQRGPASPPTSAAPRALANVYAVLVHERPECVIDLVRNLRWHDDASPIVLYDGSPAGTLIDPRLPWARWGVEAAPHPRPMKWGKLHGFALDCIAHLGRRDYDCLTIVDSDQLALRRGYPAFLGAHLAGRRFGLLSNDARRQAHDTHIPPAQTAQAERALWAPLLDRFAHGHDAWVHWSFWPASVIGADAARDIARLFADPQVEDIMARSRLWATEEVLFPSFAALLGHDVVQNPCAAQWTQYRRSWNASDFAQAAATPSAFWMHPVPRTLDHPLRAETRARAGHYRTAPAAPISPDSAAHRDVAVMAQMRTLAGWLEDDEARLILATARDACRAALAAGDAPHLVEIGSYAGKATVLLGHVARANTGQVTAIDRFDGVCGSRDGAVHRALPTRVRFEAAIEEAGLAGIVHARTGDAPAVTIEAPVDFALIDGWHDYAGVMADFCAIEPLLAPHAPVLFHDYADYYPGVMAFVDELVASGDWAISAAAGSLRVLSPAGADAPAQPRTRIPA